MNGQDYCKNTRGHNIVVIDPVTGDLISRVFDTWLNNVGVKAMTDFLNNEVGYESIVIMAVQDAAEGLYFDEEDIATMESLGAGGDGCPVQFGERWRRLNGMNYYQGELFKM